MASIDGCKFCQIALKAVPSAIVFEDSISLAFLDYRPLFPGHTLLIPKDHFESLSDLPANLVSSFFGNVQLLAGAVERGLKAQGTFVAINNKVSQSVPHLHVHIVPRKKGDGLRGFFWPRQKYKDEEAIGRAQAAIVGELPPPRSVKYWGRTHRLRKMGQEYT
jgi:histidine triad (HIT) family protein